MDGFWEYLFWEIYILEWCLELWCDSLGVDDFWGRVLCRVMIGWSIRFVREGGVVGIVLDLYNWCLYGDG